VEGATLVGLSAAFSGAVKPIQLGVSWLRVRFLLSNAEDVYRAGQYEYAIIEYSKVLAIRPTHLRALHSRGAAWLLKGDAERAIVDFTDVLRLDPCHALAYQNRGPGLLQSARVRKRHR
jgi:Flp pilus assembly protein TadD